MQTKCVVVSNQKCEETVIWIHNENVFVVNFLFFIKVWFTRGMGSLRCHCDCYYHPPIIVPWQLRATVLQHLWLDLQNLQFNCIPVSREGMLLSCCHLALDTLSSCTLYRVIQRCQLLLFFADPMIYHNSSHFNLSHSLARYLRLSSLRSSDLILRHLASPSKPQITTWSATCIFLRLASWLYFKNK